MNCHWLGFADTNAMTVHGKEYTVRLPCYISSDLCSFFCIHSIAAMVRKRRPQEGQSTMVSIVADLSNPISWRWKGRSGLKCLPPDVASLIHCSLVKLLLVERHSIVKPRLVKRCWHTLYIHTFIIEWQHKHAGFKNKA